MRYLDVILDKPIPKDVLNRAAGNGFITGAR